MRCFSGHIHIPIVEGSTGSLILCTGQGGGSEAIHQRRCWESHGSVKCGAHAAPAATALGPGEQTEAQAASELSLGRCAELLLRVQVR